MYAIRSYYGWGDHNGESAEEILSQEREKTWSFIRELVSDMSVFDTFLYEKDFHNLKAAIKQVYIRNEVPNIFINDGTVDANQIYEAVKNHDFSILPEHMHVITSYSIHYTKLYDLRKANLRRVSRLLRRGRKA